MMRRLEIYRKRPGEEETEGGGRRVRGGGGPRTDQLGRREKRRGQVRGGERREKEWKEERRVGGRQASFMGTEGQSQAPGQAALGSQATQLRAVLHRHPARPLQRSAQSRRADSPEDLAP